MRKLLYLVVILFSVQVLGSTAEAQVKYKNTLERSLVAANATIIYNGYEGNRLNYISFYKVGSTYSVITFQVFVWGDLVIGSIKSMHLNINTLAFSTNMSFAEPQCDGPMKMLDYVGTAHERAIKDNLGSALVNKIQSFYSTLTFATVAACM